VGVNVVVGVGLVVGVAMTTGEVGVNVAVARFSTLRMATDFAGASLIGAVSEQATNKIGKKTKKKMAVRQYFPVHSGFMT
jgi:hypothetical protein